MQPIWYGDNRDLLKWGTLVHLAEHFNLQRILQVAYLRPSKFPEINLNGRNQTIPDCVLDHFRTPLNAEKIDAPVPISVLETLFSNRSKYHEAVKTYLEKYGSERCLVFLDPDTGLEPPGGATSKHVRETEAKAIWEAMKPQSVFAFYQHKSTRRNEDWKEIKRRQLAAALGIERSHLKTSEATPTKMSLPKDVVIFHALRE